MKKALLLLVCMCAIATSYAQKGESAIGGNLNYADEAKLGLGIKYRYGITDQLRIEPAINYYFKQDYFSMWDFGANLHYVFPVAEKISLYPLGGLGYAHSIAHLSDMDHISDDVSDGNLAITLGGGADFKLGSKLVLNLEAKYQIIDNANQFVVSAGVVIPF